MKGESIMYKWKPSKAKAKAFAEDMDRVREFCAANGIDASASYDSYYFCINGVRYRMSNHTMESSNARAYDPVTGEQRRELYHADGRESDTVYIHAGKTRIIEIYSALKAGKAVDGRGYVKD